MDQGFDHGDPPDLDEEDLAGMTIEEPVDEPVDLVEALDEVFTDEEPTNPLSPLPTNYEYRDWRPEDTRVVAYTTSPEKYPRDKTTTSLAAARAEVEAIYGRILETNQVPGRFFFRVHRVRTP